MACKACSGMKLDVCDVSTRIFLHFNSVVDLSLWLAAFGQMYIYTYIYMFM